MQFAIKKLTLLGLIVAFTTGLLCATMAAPGRALGAESDCSQNHSGMAMSGCDISIFCRSGSSSNLRIALRSSHPDDLFKFSRSVGLTAVLTDATRNDPLMLANGRGSGSPHISLKVSVHLFNSVLNL